MVGAASVAKINREGNLVSLLEIGPIRLFAYEAGPIKLLVSGRLCMGSSGYLVEDRFFFQRSEGTSIIYLQAIFVPVLTNLTLNHLKVGYREGPSTTAP